MKYIHEISIYFVGKFLNATNSFDYINEVQLRSVGKNDGWISGQNFFDPAFKLM